MDARNGKQVWQEKLGGKFSSSPMLADGRIYLCSREGVTHVFRPGDKFQSIATNQLDGAFFASPIAFDGTLILRTDKALYRIGK